MAQSAEFQNQLEKSELTKITNCQDVDVDAAFDTMIKTEKEIPDRLENMQIAGDVSPKVSEAFLQQKDALSKAKNGAYVGNPEGPGFKKIDQSIFYNSQGRSDNSRGKIDEKDTYYAIFDNKAYEVSEENIITIGIRHLLRLSTDAGWKLLDKNFNELSKDEKGYYKVEGTTGGIIIDDFSRYKIDENGQLMEKAK